MKLINSYPIASVWHRDSTGDVEDTCKQKEEALFFYLLLIDEKSMKESSK